MHSLSELGLKSHAVSFYNAVFEAFYTRLVNILKSRFEIAEVAAVRASVHHLEDSLSFESLLHQVGARIFVLLHLLEKA